MNGLGATINAFQKGPFAAWPLCLEPWSPWTHTLYGVTRVWCQMQRWECIRLKFPRCISTRHINASFAHRINVCCVLEATQWTFKHVAGTQCSPSHAIRVHPPTIATRWDRRDGMVFVHSCPTDETKIVIHYWSIIYAMVLVTSRHIFANEFENAIIFSAANQVEMSFARFHVALDAGRHFTAIATFHRCASLHTFSNVFL